IQRFVHDDQLIVQPSSSLLHVPVTKKLEKKLDRIILDGLSFADEKLEEIVILAKGIASGRTAIKEEIEIVSTALAKLQATDRSNDTVRNTVSELTPEAATRNTVFAERINIQKKN